MDTAGKKLDEGKPRWDLLPYGPLGDVVDVLTYGANKYSAGNWMGVTDARSRYFAAAMRHLVAWRFENKDRESGLPHLAHAICCLMFLIWFDKKEEIK